MKLTFDQALEAINDGRNIKIGSVQAQALRRKIWVASWGLPGCLAESVDVCITKTDAIDSACSMAEGEDGVPRGMKTALAKTGRFESKSPLYGICINTIEQQNLSDIF